MMKNFYACLITAITLQIICTQICNAQSDVINLKPAPAKITIDGDLQEWGDSLTYFNNDAQINYSIANDKDNLYLAFKTNDPVYQAKILKYGVTFSIDTKGKKRSTYNITFPMQEDQSKSFGSTSEDQERKLAAGLTKLRKLKVEGFKDVEYDQITIDNTYGFKVAINYDDHGFLVYEEAVPLTLLHADDLKKNEWAFNIKINGVQKTESANNSTEPNAMGGGRGGRRGGGGGGMGGGGRGGRGGGGFANNRAPADASAKSIDFWGKFYLAKQ